MSDTRAERLRMLNDRFRRTFAGGHVMMTNGIKSFGRDRVAAICAQVKAFDLFTEDNDPYGEHDMGGFTEQGQRVFWKIDYYDLDMEHGSEDPSDETKTCRVLTIMLADEW